MRTISAAIAVALVIGFVPFARAAKVNVAPRYPTHNSVMLLDDRSAGHGGGAVDAYAVEHNYIEKQNVWR